MATLLPRYRDSESLGLIHNPARNRVSVVAESVVKDRRLATAIVKRNYCFFTSEKAQKRIPRSVQGLRSNRKNSAALVVLTEMLQTAPLTVTALVKGLQRLPASRLRVLSTMKPE